MSRFDPLTADLAKTREIMTYRRPNQANLALDRLLRRRCAFRRRSRRGRVPADRIKLV